MEYYRIYYLLKEFEDYVDKENKQQNKQQTEAQKNFKMPSNSFGDFKMPNFELPKFDTPSF